MTDRHIVADIVIDVSLAMVSSRLVIYGVNVLSEILPRVSVRSKSGDSRSGRHRAMGSPRRSTAHYRRSIGATE